MNYWRNLLEEKLMGREAVGSQAWRPVAEQVMWAIVPQSENKKITLIWGIFAVLLIIVYFTSASNNKLAIFKLSNEPRAMKKKLPTLDDTGLIITIL